MVWLVKLNSSWVGQRRVLGGRGGVSGNGGRGGGVGMEQAGGQALLSAGGRWGIARGLRLEPVLKEVDWFLVRGHLPEATLTDFSLVPVM